MIRIQIRVTAQQKQALKRRANGQPLNQIIRQAIDEYIERHEKKEKR
jgi:hypothetical protein